MRAAPRARASAPPQSAPSCELLLAPSCCEAAAWVDLCFTPRNLGTLGLVWPLLAVTVTTAVAPATLGWSAGVRCSRFQDKLRPPSNVSRNAESRVAGRGFQCTVVSSLCERNILIQTFLALVDLFPDVYLLTPLWFRYLMSKRRARPRASHTTAVLVGIMTAQVAAQVHLSGVLSITEAKSLALSLVRLSQGPPG